MYLVYDRAVQTERLVDALERIVIGAVSLTTRALAEAAPGADLTFPQWRAIVVLGEDDDGARVGAVALRVGTTQPATGRLLRRLERRGLVVLATDETDRRATRASLTHEGRQVRAAIIASRRAALVAIAEMEPTDRARCDRFVEALADAFARFA